MIVELTDGKPITLNLQVQSRITKPAIICVCCVPPPQESFGSVFSLSDRDSRVPINLLACQFPTLNSLRRHFRKAVHTAYSFSRPPSSMTSITHWAVMHLHTLTTSGLTLELRQHARKDSPTQFPLRYSNNMLPVTPPPPNITLRTS